MPWKRLPNGLRKSISGWPAADNDEMVQHDCSVAKARRFALKDPNINCFFICRERTTDKYKQNDAVFFTLDDRIVSELIGHKTSDPGQDLYVKAGMSVAFYDPNDARAEPLASACRYTTSDGDAAVDIVCIFAANVVREIPEKFTALAGSSVKSINKEKPTIAVANEKIFRVLKDEGTINKLKQRGITVLLTVMNHHQDTGLSEFGPVEKDDASQLAKQLKAAMKKYGLDGVDIDDEYSSNQDKRRNGQPEAKDESVLNSLAMLSAKLAYEFRHKNLIVSKSLFEDVNFFGQEYTGKNGVKYKLEDMLTYGWEMSYREVASTSLGRYVGKMTKHKLLKGFKPTESSKDINRHSIDWLKMNGYAGFMVFNFQLQEGQNLMGTLVENWLGEGNWKS